MAEQIRVRFAPSPTGYLHVGGARTALFNWLYARKEGGVFVLRVEDTDRERSSDEMTQAILDGMRWLGLEWDEGPYHQADGIERHRADVGRLLEGGRAYRCFCTQEELQAKREAAGAEYRYDRACASLPPEEATRRLGEGDPHTVRFRVPEGGTEWDDVVHGPTRFRNEDIEDFIVLRTDGTPIYNLAVVSDDIDMRITHVIRGDDHLANTPKQILIYRALGAAVPTFAHLPMILGPDGKRLSKRHGATSVGEYREQGILPEALVNFLALLGWNPGDDQEIMPPPELVERFSLERVNKKSAVFDPAKLEWMNGQYLMATPPAELAPAVGAALVEAGLLDADEVESRHAWLSGVVEMLQPRSRTLAELVEQSHVYLSDRFEYEPAAVAKIWKSPAEAADRLGVVRTALAEVDPWTPAAIEDALRRAAEEAGAGFGKIVQPLRLALTGGTASPGIDVVVAAIGREGVLRRIDRAIDHLAALRQP